MKLYGMPLSTRVNKVRMLAHLLDIDYDFNHINLFEREQKSENFLNMSIIGKIPVIDDDGFFLSESNTILRYLSDKYKAEEFYPHDLKERTEINKWLDYISMHLDDGINRIMFNKFIAPKVGINPSERSVKEGLFAISTALPIIEQQLENNPFIAGDHMTIADICLLSTLDPLEVIDVDITAFPVIVKWQEHMKNHSFYTATHASYKQAVKNYMQSVA